MRPAKKEVEKRVENLLNATSNRNLDAILIAHFVNLYYFANSSQMGFLVFGDKLDPTYFVIRDWRRAENESIWPVEPSKNIRDLLKFLKGKEVKVMGIEGDKIPYSLAVKISGFLNAELVDISREIRTIRAVKSEYEISMLRKACEIEDRVFERAKEYMREGMTELELDAELRRVSRILGHQGILRMHGWNQEMIQSHVYSGPHGSFISYLDAPITGPGVTPAVPQGCGYRVLRRSEPIIIDFGVGYNGYIADQTRTFSIGKLPEKFIKAYDVALEIKEDMEGFVREGVKSSEVFHRAESIAEKRGLINHFMGYGNTRVSFIGHGVGLELDEFPVLASRFDMELKEGMVFAFEPKFIFPGEGAVGLESLYLVKKNGVEKLPKTEDCIFEV